MPENSSVPSPSAYSPLSISGHSLQTALLTVNEGQWSNISEILRTSTQSQQTNNFQMLTRGVWSNPTGIGWSLQRSAVFNGGAAFMDFGTFIDAQGNQTLLFQVGNTLYSYNLTTNVETAYGGALTALSTSLVNLPTMRNFVDSTSSVAPFTVYTNGSVQPQKICATADKNGVITEYPVPTLSSTPTGICVGPDGNIWGTENTGNKIFKIIPMTGAYTEFTIPTASSGPIGICSGPDGNLWFVENTANKIGKMTTAGAFTEYALPTPSSSPFEICLGPDNLLWFTESANNKIASITTNGLITEYTIPTTTSTPRGICAGPDGLIWFVEKGTNKIGKVTVSTSTNPLPGTFTEYTIPTGTSSSTGICLGGDGRLWFTETNANKIGAVTTTGTFTEYSTGLTAAAFPAGICPANDGNVWFCENSLTANKIGMITPAGVITEYPVPTSSSNPSRIVFGGNNQLWFTEQNANNTGALQLSTVPMQFKATVNTTPTTPTVTITEYSIPNSTTTALQPQYIINSPTDSNMYFTTQTVGGGSSQLFKLTTAGVATAVGTLTGVPILGLTQNPTTNAIYTAENNGASSEIFQTALNPYTSTALTGVLPNFPQSTCMGPDGNLWFTIPSANTINKCTPSGTVTSFTVPTGSSNPWGICSGPDGRLWFTEGGPIAGGNKIGAITTSGTFTEYNTGLTAAAGVRDIISGPDGNLWFSEYLTNKIGRITTGGTITEFALPTANAGPTGLCTSQDGNIYFCENTAGKIGMITTGGVITEYTIPIITGTTPAAPYQICLGPDGNLWFTENNGNKVGKFVRTVSTTPTLTVQTGSWPGTYFLTGKTYSKPKYSCYFNNRQVYFGFDPSTLAAYDVLISNQGDAEKFTNSSPTQATDSAAFTIPDLGLPTGCTAFRLTNTNNLEVLLLGFQNGIAVISGNQNSSDATTYAVTILTKDYGLMSNRTFTQIQNDLYFLSTNGVRNYSNLTINANLLNSNLTYQMQDVIQDITTTKVAGSNIQYNSQAFSVHHRATLEVQYWYPGNEDGVSGANFINQHAIIMNYNSLTPTPQQLNPIFSTKNGTSVACGIEFLGTFYGGGYDGRLQTHYSGNTYNGAAIPGTLSLALANSGNLQQTLELRQGVVVTEGAAQDFNVTTYFYTMQADGVLVRQPSPEGSQELAAGVENLTILDSWILDTSSFPANHIKHLLFQAEGQGNYIEFALTTNGVTQALDFDALALTITVGGLRP